MFMANQFITVENQTLLWKTIQRSPQFVNNTISINREQWFSSIIKQFYENIKSPKMTIAELKALNQQTIAYMIGDLKRIESMYIVPPTTVVAPPTQMNFETPQTRMSMYSDQFNARQQEYANMGKPPAPPIANFSEKVEDEAITNMDELLQQQMKQREYDIAQVRPPPPPISTVAEPAKSSSSSSLMNADIMAVIQELTKQLEELRTEVRILKEHTAHNSGPTVEDRSSQELVVKSIKQQMEIPGVEI
jgi:hypothetical protein